MALLLGATLLLAWERGNPSPLPSRVCLQKLCRRLCRLFPAIFSIVATLGFLGGTICAPANYDALTYRLPRILHWLSAGGWHWIPTINERMNFSGPAWEWIALPQIALLHSDRGLFLIDFTGFLLMPGLLFSVFTQIGVTRRVAWTWMWILPLAHGYALQASSVGNDLTGTIFCLAAVHYALRARRSGNAADVWLCGLSAALLTGSKLSNLPLLLPCLVAVWPALPCLLKRWRTTIAVALAALVVSAAPIMLLNQLNAGHWGGDPDNKCKVQIHNPLAGLAGNGFLLAQTTFMPPFLPNGNKVNTWMLNHLPGPAHRLLMEQFPRIFSSRLGELPSEEGAALGLGVGLPLSLTLMASVFFRRKNIPFRPSFRIIFSAGFAAWVAFIFFLTKMGSEAGPRLLLPYYPLVIAPLLALHIHDRLLSFRIWRWFLALGAASVLCPLILSPNRPLWPAVRVTEKLAREHPHNATLQRMANVYSTYASRNDVLAPVRNNLPRDVYDIAFLGNSNDTDYSLWRPFGSRRVQYLSVDGHPGIQIPPGIEWLVVKTSAWPQTGVDPFDDWAALHHATIIWFGKITTLVSWGPETWCILHVESH